MKLTILIDNNTFIDEYLLGEPALSIFIEEDNKKILFDAGYSDAFIKNAVKLNKNLKDLDYLIFSHGHNDHTWGLVPLTELYTESYNSNKPVILAHPLAFNSKYIKQTEGVGSKLSIDKLQNYFDFNLTKSPFWITDKFVFLGEIPRNNDFECRIPIGKVKTDSGLQDDFLLDDSALVYKSQQGLVIITGCSHSGICNIIDYAKKVCNESKIVDIIGGLHLLKTENQYMSKTLNYLKSCDIAKMHPCHCTDLQAKISLSSICNIQESASGLILEYN